MTAAPEQPAAPHRGIKALLTGVRWSSSSSPPTPAHGSLQYHSHSPQTALASCHSVSRTEA